MKTITFKDNIELAKTKFINMLDLYNYIIDHQIITELGFVSKSSLSKENKIHLKKSIKSSKLINI